MLWRGSQLATIAIFLFISPLWPCPQWADCYSYPPLAMSSIDQLLYISQLCRLLCRLLFRLLCRLLNERQVLFMSSSHMIQPCLSSSRYNFINAPFMNFVILISQFLCFRFICWKNTHNIKLNRELVIRNPFQLFITNLMPKCISEITSRRRKDKTKGYIIRKIDWKIKPIDVKSGRFAILIKLRIRGGMGRGGIYMVRGAQERANE